MYKVSIIGVTGYTGIELLRYLCAHPGVKIENLVSSSQYNSSINDIYPQFTGINHSKLINYCAKSLSKSDLVFTALPHGISQQIVAELIDHDLKVIDLSGDYRYNNIDIYQKWYHNTHNYPELAKKAVYGLTELNKDKIKTAQLVANPGCYPTASLLGLLPLASQGIIKDNHIIIDAKSGVSGAGKNLRENLIYSEVDENIKAYSIFTHRHTSEIQNILNLVSKNKEYQLTFTPHLIPMKRGILSTIYLKGETSFNQEEFNKIFQDYYNKSSFVTFLNNSLPETKYLRGGNCCHLSCNFNKESGMLIILSAIDNLGKGAAGQAVQNMNLMLGLPEETGLLIPGLIP